MNDVLLMTVTREGSSEPIAHGIYPDIPQALQQLNVMGMHPGFDTKDFKLFNDRGEQRGALVTKDDLVISLAAMSPSMAARIASNDPLVTVPDTLEGLDA